MSFFFTQGTWSESSTGFLVALSSLVRISVVKPDKNLVSLVVYTLYRVKKSQGIILKTAEDPTLTHPVGERPPEGVPRADRSRDDGRCGHEVP